MFIVTTHLECPAKLRRSGMNGVLAAPSPVRPSESDYMPLLRSLAEREARVATNMALLTELSHRRRRPSCA